MYRLLIADDHPLFRDAISRTLASTTTLDTRGAPLNEYELLEADSLTQALVLIDTHADSLDLMLLDLDLPDSHGLEGLAQLRTRVDWLPVAILSANEEREMVLEALALGAVGYLSKSSSAEALREALARMLAGEVHVPAQLMRAAPRPEGSSHVTPTESQPSTQLAPSMNDATFLQHWHSLTGKQRGVLERMVLGESNKMIAWQLGVAETTIKSHVSAILRKLGVTSRVQAILIASRTLSSRSTSHPSS